MATVLFDTSILGTEARVRGIGRYVTELALGLARLAHEFPDVEVRFIDRIGWDGTARFALDVAESVARFTSSSAFEPHKVWAYRWRLNVSRAVRASGADLLHQGYPNVTPLGRLGALRLVTCHDLIPLRYPEHYTNLADGFGLGRRWLDRRRFDSADHVLAISHATARDLTEQLAIDPQKISVVHNGIDTTRWSDEARALDNGKATEGRQNYFLYVGDGDWRKNHERLFRALAMARARAPELDLRLLWAGRLSLARQRWALQTAEVTGVARALSLLGYVSDAELQALYQKALGTVFVSLAEGFGLPVLESMAVGSPVITSDRSSMVEVAAGAALLVDPTSVDAIADALCRLAKDRVLARELARRGLERSREFSLHRQARETLAVYRRCLSTRPPGISLQAGLTA